MSVRVFLLNDKWKKKVSRTIFSRASIVLLSKIEVQIFTAFSPKTVKIHLSRKPKTASPTSLTTSQQWALRTHNFNKIEIVSKSSLWVSRCLSGIIEERSLSVSMVIEMYRSEPHNPSNSELAHNQNRQPTTVSLLTTTTYNSEPANPTTARERSKPCPTTKTSYLCYPTRQQQS